jgi:ribosomal RNA-processing protein 9
MRCMQAAGRLQRKIARSVSIPDQSQPSTSGSGVSWYGAGKLHRCHRLAVTAVALTADDTTAFTVSKDGTIFKWDLATMKKQQLHRPGHDKAAAEKQQGTTADWVYRGSRQGSTLALYAAAVSSDGMYLAVGGGDKAVHVFDACSGAYVKGYPGHKDIVSGLAFREGERQLPVQACCGAACSMRAAVRVQALHAQLLQLHALCPCALDAPKQH